MEPIPVANDKPLFTPGPLTTSRTVKQAMLRDVGSRDGEFLRVVREMRARLLAVAHLENEFECVLMQGSGTVSVEAVIGTMTLPDGKIRICDLSRQGRECKLFLHRLYRAFVSIRYGKSDTGDARDVG